MALYKVSIEDGDDQYQEYVIDAPEYTVLRGSPQLPEALVSFAQNRAMEASVTWGEGPHLHAQVTASIGRYFPGRLGYRKDNSPSGMTSVILEWRVQA